MLITKKSMVFKKYFLFYNNLPTFIISYVFFPAAKEVFNAHCITDACGCKGITDVTTDCYGMSSCAFEMLFFKCLGLFGLFTVQFEFCYHCFNFFLYIIKKSL